MARLLVLAATLAVLGFQAGPVYAGSPVAAEITVARIDRLRITALANVGKRLVAAGERGRILFSDDEGKTWQTATSPGSASLTAMSFTDSLGLAVGHDGTVLRSEDGAKSWNAIDLAANDHPALLAVYTDGMKAIAVGSYGAYFESRDAGKSWQRRNIGPVDFDKHLTGIAPAGTGQLIISGEAGTLLRSGDGGNNWSVLKSPYAGSFFGILGLKNGSVIIYGMRGQAYRSDDAGLNWQRIELGGQSSAIQGGRELVDGRVLLYGNDGMLAVKYPGEGNFKSEQLPNRNTLAALLPVGDRFLVAGPRGLNWSGQERKEK